MNEKLSNETSECIFLHLRLLSIFLNSHTHDKVFLSILNYDLQQFVSGSPAPGLYIWLCSRMRTAHLQNIFDCQFFHRLP